MKVKQIKKGWYSVSGVSTAGTIGNERVIVAKNQKDAERIAKELNKRYWKPKKENRIEVWV